MPTSREAYYKFIAKNALRGLIWFAAILVFYLVFNQYLGEEFKTFAEPLSDRPLLILLIFFLSETIFGIIPLEFFVIWAKNMATGSYFIFILFSLILALLSYVGGMIAYYVGTKIKDLPLLAKLLERESFLEYKKLYRRYGGILIILSALTPLPFATFSLLSASMGFPFNRYLLYSAARFIRFIYVAVIVWLAV